MDFQSNFESSRDEEDHEGAPTPSAAPPLPSSTLFSTTEPAMQTGGAIPGYRKADASGTRRILPTSLVGQGISTPMPTENPPISSPDLSLGPVGPSPTDPAVMPTVQAKSHEARRLREKLERQLGTSTANSTTFRSALRGGGGGGGAVSFANLVLWLVGLLPVSTFAYPFQKWNKIPVASLPIFVNTMQKFFPEVYTAVSKPLLLRGDACRRAVEEAVDVLFGFFAGNMHSAFLYVIIVYVWFSHPSPCQGEMNFFMYLYIRTAHKDLQRFMSQCKDPFTMKLDSAALTRAILTANVRRLPGFIRLDPDISESTLESHWMFVVHCATEMLAQGED